MPLQNLMQCYSLQNCRTAVAVIGLVRSYELFKLDVAKLSSRLSDAVTHGRNTRKFDCRTFGS